MMPTYEQILVESVKSKEEIIRLMKANARLSKKKEKVIRDTAPGLWISFWILLFFNLVTGAFVVLESGILN